MYPSRRVHAWATEKILEAFCNDPALEQVRVRFVKKQLLLIIVIRQLNSFSFAWRKNLYLRRDRLQIDAKKYVSLFSGRYVVVSNLKGLSTISITKNKTYGKAIHCSH